MRVKSFYGPLDLLKDSTCTLKSDIPYEFGFRGGDPASHPQCVWRAFNL